MGSVGLGLPLLIVLLSGAGYAVTSATIRSDRNSDAARRIEVDTAAAQVALGRAQAYAIGLGKILADEPVPGQQRFVQLAGGTAGGVGLLEAMWVERVPGSARSRYEAQTGNPITRPTPAGSFAPAPRAPSYLPATFTTGGSPELPPGADVSGWPGLAAAIHRGPSASSVTASGLGSLGGQRGFFLVQAGSFGHGPDSRGYLVVFVPQGWLTSTIGGDPRLLAVSLAGRHLEGFESRPARSSTFQILGRRWRIGVANAPPTGLQSLLPWLAVAWPIAVALIAVVVGRGVARRRRAEREVTQIFDLSLDLLCIAGFDGHFKQVNPPFERTLGYTTQELLSRPFLDFVHPDDRARTAEAMGVLERGEELVEFENRYMCAEGSARWLQWSARPMPDEGLIYAAARDVTDRRHAVEELQETHRMVEASRDELRRLAAEQAALRRVATLVATGAPHEEVFAAVTAEVERLLGSELANLSRFESDRTFTILASAHGRFPVGSRWPIGGNNVTTVVFETGRPARIDNFIYTGPLADDIQGEISSAVGSPIIVEGRLWGAIGLGSTGEPLPADTEERLASFTELLATAIANAESRAQLVRLAKEQAALGRVATLVARGTLPEEVFASVTEEVERLFGSDGAALARFGPDGAFTIVASAGGLFPVGSRWPIGGKNVTTSIFQTSRPARIDNLIATGPSADLVREAGVRSSVGAPIIVDGHLWGVMGVVSTGEDPPPRDAEARLAGFTELVAMAIANAQNRAALRPVERMRSQAEQITERELSARLPVSEDTGEVTALGRTLNSMLDRVEEAVARERRVVSDASHELRTPLTTLRAEVDLALMGDRDKPELRAALESASEEAKRMSRLADDLLVLARADQGRLPLHPRPLVARELLEAAAARAGAGAEVRGRSIAVAEPANGCAVRADPDRAAQVLDNLITNALLYGDGTITLSARIAAHDVELHVTDEGDGFPDELLPRAFERFGRGQHARANEPGSGLGLALVEAVAVAHGGHAEACNRPGGGADVSFTLPVA